MSTDNPPLAASDPTRPAETPSLSPTTTPSPPATPTKTRPGNHDEPPKNNVDPAVAATNAVEVTREPEAVGRQMRDAPVAVEAPEKRPPTPTTADPKTRLTRLSESVSAVRGIITNLLVLIVLLMIVGALVAEVRRQSVVIDPIVLPKDVLDSGWSPDYVSQRLNDKVHNIVDKNGLKYSASQIDIRRQFIKEG